MARTNADEKCMVFVVRFEVGEGVFLVVRKWVRSGSDIRMRRCSLSMIGLAGFLSLWTSIKSLYISPSSSPQGANFLLRHNECRDSALSSGDARSGLPVPTWWIFLLRNGLHRPNARCNL